MPALPPGGGTSQGGSGADATARRAAAAAQATADAALPKAGGTMTGKIVLDGAPTSDLHAASKKYVDDNAGGSGADATARAAAAQAQATADAALPKAGGTMTGKIVLDGAPTSDLHAASKKYVDDNAGGSGTDATARAAAAQAQATADAALPKAGGTMTGALTLNAAPTADLQAATKKYVDDNAGGGPTPTGDLSARVERINFENVARADTDVELTPSAGGISVVNGTGDPEILSGISGNDFTVAAGVYLVNVHASFNFGSGGNFAGFDVRRASDDAELDHSNPIRAGTDQSIWSARILLILAAATAVNIQATRSGNSALSAIHAEFVKLSSGGAVHSAHNRGIGWAAQQVPTNAEILAATTFTTDVLNIPAEPSDGDGWLFFYVPDDAGAPDSAYFDGNTHDILGGFTRLASGTFAGHIVYGSNAEQDPAILGTGDRTLTLEYDG